MKHEKAKGVFGLRDDLAEWFRQNQQLFPNQNWDAAAEMLISEGWIDTERLLALEEEGT